MILQNVNQYVINNNLREQIKKSIQNNKIWIQINRNVCMNNLAAYAGASWKKKQTTHLNSIIIVELK